MEQKKLETEVDGADGQPIASTPIPLQRTGSSLSSCKQKKKWNVGDCVQTNSASLIFIPPATREKRSQPDWGASRRGLDAARKPGRTGM